MSSFKRNKSALDRLGTACAGLVLVALVGCGEYGGGNTVAVTTGGTGQGSVPAGLSQTEQVAAFSATVYPVVQTYCADGCHDTGAKGAPFLFANSDPGTAYTIITQSQKVNLSAPAQSRVVRRPAGDFHECGSSCVQIGAEMLMAVEAWAAAVESAGGGGEQVSVDGIASAEQAYTDGVELENGERYTNNMIAFFDFKDGSGDMVLDKSGFDPPMDLEIRGSVEWMDSWGLEIEEGRAQSTEAGALKLYEEIGKPGQGTDQYTVEMWITPGNITQEDARVVTYSRSGGNRNFSLEQQQYQYDYRNRSLAADSNNDGRRTLLTYDVDQDAQETLQHVVLTYDLVSGRRIYVDGVWTDDPDPLDGARLWNWDDRGQFVIGAERNSEGSWRGQIRLLAIYKQALKADQIRMNYLAGVGKRLRLSFSIEDWTGVESEVEFSVTTLDSHSYLFCQPTFVGENLNGLRMKNMRVQVNPRTTGAPSAQGQAFSNLSTVITGDEHQVSRQCSIIPQIDGPGQDTFSIVFEELSVFSDPVNESVLTYTPSNLVLPLPPDSGFRDFARIHSSFQAVTGVDPLANRAVDPNNVDPIEDTFQELKQQLPSTADLRSVVSSHQVGVTKLAFEYCVEMVDRPTLRSAAFGSEFEAGNPSFFDSDVASAFSNTTLSDLLVTRLVDHMLGSRQITDQPDSTGVVADLVQLRDELVGNCGPCDAERTKSIAKGLCTAITASAPIMVH